MAKKKVPMASPYPVRFDEETYLKLQQLASIESRSMNKQIELAVKHMISDYEKNNGVIEVDVDALNE